MRLDTLGVQETHLRRYGVSEHIKDYGREVWEAMEGTVWSGVNPRREGRGREGCAFLISPVWEALEGHGRKGSRILWIVGKTGIVRYAWVCACVCGPASVANGKGRDKMRNFWNDVNNCLRKIEEQVDINRRYGKKS